MSKSKEQRAKKRLNGDKVAGVEERERWRVRAFMNKVRLRRKMRKQGDPRKVTPAIENSSKKGT